MTMASWGLSRLAAAVGISALVVLLNACLSSGPSLRANVAVGARDVPLQLNLQIMAEGASLENAILQRVDAPSEPIPLGRTANGAETALQLAPDAQYRILASAQPVSKTSLPWQTESTPAPQISLDQVFSTVETPVLVDADAVRVISRGGLLDLRFSQPLASARVDGGGASGSIRTEDPRVLQVTVLSPAPGAELLLHLTDVVSVAGVAAPDSSVDARVPGPVKLAAVSGKGAAASVGLPVDAKVTLDWSRAVSSIEYRVDGDTKKWSGAATDSVQLPFQATEGKTFALTILDAVAADGGWLPEQQSFEIATAVPLSIAAMWPTNGEAGVSPTSPPVVRFSEDVADRAVAEAAISFEPSVPGHFDWIAPNRVRFVSDHGFPADTEVTMRVDGNPGKIRGISGGYLDEAAKASYTTGKLKVIDVSLSKQVMTLLENDEPVWTAPVATGVKGAETPTGTFQVLYKMPQARFRGVNPDGSRYDIPDVHWVMAFQGDYTIHGAYWRGVFGRPGSDGCVSLTDANAKHVFDWAEDFTPILIHI